jgi:hypothetical protein
MKTLVKCIIIIFILIFFHAISAICGEWKLIVDKDGITLYAREVNGHPEAQFKGVCIVRRPIEAVGSVLSDVGAYPKWFFKCIEAKKIPTENSSELHFFLYVAIDAPWPFSDRDVVYKTDVTIDYESGKVVSHSIALKRSFIPLPGRYVRITDSEHQWILERISVDRTRITFMNRTNASGPFAGFISNPGIRDTMIHSLKNLKKMFNHPDANEKTGP